MSLNREPLKKVSIKKIYPVKFLIDDKKGNFIPYTAIRRIDAQTGEVFGISEEEMNKLLEEDRGKRSKITTQVPGGTEEIIVTSETNDLVVYGGIIFYKSSATSSTTEKQGRDTWIPSLGLYDSSLHGGHGKKKGFQITKLDRDSDKKFEQPDERIKKYLPWLGKELMDKFNNFDIMIMSAEIGGGFWDTENGKQVINEMRKDGIFVIPGSVQISNESQDTFELPLEGEGQDLLKQKTIAFNEFFAQQNGSLHNGVVNNTEQKTPVRDVKKEVYDRAAAATSKNRNQPHLIEYPIVIAEIQDILNTCDQQLESVRKIQKSIDLIQKEIEEKPLTHDCIGSCRAIMHVMSREIQLLKEKQGNLSKEEKMMMEKLGICNSKAGEIFITLASHFKQEAQNPISTPQQTITMNDLNRLTRGDALARSYMDENARAYINEIYNYMELNDESKHSKGFQRARALLLPLVNGTPANDQNELMRGFLKTGKVSGVDSDKPSLFSSKGSSTTDSNALRARFLEVQKKINTKTSSPEATLTSHNLTIPAQH